MRYAAHETLVAPARASASLGRLAAGIVLTVVVFTVLSVGYSALLPRLFGPDRWAEAAAGIAKATTPAGVIVNLLAFALLLAALALSLRVVHGRGLWGLIGPLPRAVFQFRRALVAVALLYGVMLLVPLPEAQTPERNLATGTWLRLLPLAVGALFIQVLAEEALFRGYLQSQLAARFASPLVWLALPSLGFGLLHLDLSAHGDMAWMVAGWATLFGLVAGDLTARFGTLGPAVALHLLNNFAAILVAAPRGQFDGLALYAYPFELRDSAAAMAMMPADLLILLCGWLAIRLALRG
ncbi:MAG: CPBP family intramembrane metalloprotease [Roseovarius sp.]|nr:CPBP family intramembrane metalloprotease [Roseovarius sp.]